MPKVKCSECDEWYEGKDIQFLDIAEDISGRDLVTFECPEGHTDTSLAIGR